MTWQVEWWILWLQTARYPLNFFFFDAFSGFSCTLWGKVAFIRTELLAGTFSTSDSPLALGIGAAEAGGFIRVCSAAWAQPGEKHLGTWAEEWWKAVVGHLHQLGMDAVSWLDSCQPEAVVILGNNRWGQLTSGTLHTLNLYSPCLSGHKNMAVELLWLSENRT